MSDNAESISEGEEGEDHEMSVSQALNNPLYTASYLQLEVKTCVVCPGKILKGPRMEEIHLASNACLLPTVLSSPSSRCFIRHMYDGLGSSAASL
jgi:hypothetical protein